LFLQFFLVTKCS